ncbi:MAG: hypothetical protein ACRD2Z_05450 [Thermoanaerobaculia bacterium]
MTSQQGPPPEGTALAMKLELLAAVAQATVTAILRVLDERRGGLLTPEEEEKVGNVRTQVESAVTAVEDYMERHGDSGIDLSGLRDRLVAISRELDTRTTDADALPS